VSGQNAVEEIHAAPSPCAASTTWRFWSAAPPESTNRSRSPVRAGVGVGVRAVEGHERDEQDRRHAQDGVGPGDATSDRLRVGPVPGEVLAPALGHRVEQPCPRPVAQPEHAPGPGVVRGRRRGGRGHRGPERPVGHGAGRVEAADGPAAGDGLLGGGGTTGAEQVGRGGADQVLPGAVRQLPGQAADEDERGPAGLGAHQVGGAGDLVGDGRLGHLERRAVEVVAAALVAQGGGAGHPERHVGLPEPPRTTEGVGHDDADLDARCARAGRAQPAADRSGSSGSRSARRRPRSTCRPRRRRRVGRRGHVRGVDAAVGADEPVVGLGHEHARGVGHDPRRVPARHLAAGGPGVGRVRERDRRVLDEADDLRGDADHVAVAELLAGRAGRVDDGRSEVVAGPEPSGGRQRHHLDAGAVLGPSRASLDLGARSRHTCASAAATAGSSIIVSVTGREADGLDGLALVPSRRSITHPSSRPAVARAP
jgi:hypothetical protein